MLIESMTRQASLASRDWPGWAHDGQPYIVPMTFAYDADCLYSFSTFGQAICWMRANPKVCVEVDELREGIAEGLSHRSASRSDVLSQDHLLRGRLGCGSVCCSFPPACQAALVGLARRLHPARSQQLSAL